MNLEKLRGLPRHGPAPELCPVTETVKLIGRKWYLIILHELTKGPKGFSELRRGVRGISAKVLSSSLQHLEATGLVTRRVHSERPIRVEYALTPKGADLETLFQAMRAWGERWGLCEEAARAGRGERAPLAAIPAAGSDGRN